MSRPTALLLAAIVAAPAVAAPTTDWPQFRGPDGLGVADDTPIPATFGPDESVVWKTAIPPGNSSPCVVGGRIFLTGYEDGLYVVLALDRATGEVRWRRTFEAPAPPESFHPDAAPATPTALSDGARVIVYFATFGLAALDLDGEVLWEARLPYPGYVFGLGASPLLADGRVIVPRDGAPEAAVLAFDVETGEEAYRIDRFGYRESHGTPFLWKNADRAELIVSGNNKLTSYDPADGRELWYLDGMTAFPCTTPAADADALYYAAWSTPNATGRSFWEAGFTRSLELSDEEVADPRLLFARLDANGDGDVVPDEVPECRFKDAFGFLDENRDGAWQVDELVGVEREVPGDNVMVAIERGGAGDAKDKIRWRWERGLPYVPSPLLYRGRVWLLKSGGVVTCLDAATGEPIITRKRFEDRR